MSIESPLPLSVPYPLSLTQPRASTPFQMHSPPHEVRALVSYLELRDTYHLCLTNKSWCAKICSQNPFIKKLFDRTVSDLQVVRRFLIKNALNEAEYNCLLAIHTELVMARSEITLFPASHIDKLTTSTHSAIYLQDQSLNSINFASLLMIASYNLPQLQTLILSNLTNQDTSSLTLSEFRYLNNLDLSSCKSFRGECLKNLLHENNKIKIKHLNLSGCESFNNEDLKRLPPQLDLESLNLSGTSVSDLTPLHRHLNLRYINLHDCPAQRRPLPSHIKPINYDTHNRGHSS